MNQETSTPSRERNSTMVSLKDVSKTYGGAGATEALRNVSIDVEEG